LIFFENHCKISEFEEDIVPCKKLKELYNDFCFQNGVKAKNLLPGMVLERFEIKIKQ
jgi:hypothetical protein